MAGARRRTMPAMRLVVVSLLLLIAAGCDESPEQASRDVCTAVCQCTTNGLPSQVDRCVTQCMPQFTDVSDECLTCVYTYSQSCPALFTNCEEACTDDPSVVFGGMR